MLPVDQAELLPNFSPADHSPALPEAVGAISLAAGPPFVSASGPVWPLRGSFRMPNAGGEDEAVLRRVVVAITSGASHVTRARHAFRDAVLFEGDVAANPTDVSGYFNVNLAELFDLTNRRETFHAVVSIGTSTSEVLTCEVEFPWLDWPRPVPFEVAGDEAGEGDGQEEEGEPDEAADDDSWRIDEDPSFVG